MDGRKRQMIAEIRAAIADGTLWEAEMKRRLMHAIEYELAQTDREADLALVTGCQELLVQLHTQDESMPTADRSAESLAAVQRKLAQRSKRQAIHKGFARGVAMAAALVVLALGADILFRRQWLSGQSTEDEQDYVVRENVIDPGTVQAGTANEVAENQFIRSADLGEVISVLSFIPPVPTWLPQGWELRHYEAVVVETVELFYAVYHTQDAEKLLRYEIRVDKDPSFNVYAEQNAEGTQVTLENGLTAYISMNLELPTCVWIENGMSFLVSGPLSQDEILQMINSIERE